MKRFTAFLLSLILSFGFFSGCASKKYTVTFETYGGQSIKPLSLNVGDAIRLPVAVWSHYRFDGWFMDEGFSTEFTGKKMPAENLKLFAYFAELTGYVLSFDSNGGSKVKDIAAEQGILISEPEAPTRDGYKFEGWYTTDGELFVFSVMPGENIRLTAKWINDSGFTPVNFYGNDRLLATKYVEKDTKTTANDVISTSEYTLIGQWKTLDGQNFNFNNVIPQSDKLDLYISYRTKALNVEGDTVTSYTGNTQNAEIVLDETITSIGASAFKGKTRIKTVYLDGEVSSIAENAFSGCTNLMNISRTRFVTTVGEGAFYNCGKLVSIELTKATVISESAFGGCAMLKTVTLGEDLTEIQARAFLNCRALAQISLPEGLLTIGNYAFQNCFALKTFFAPASISSFGEGVLEGCSALESFESGEEGYFHMESDNSIYSSHGGKYTLMYINDKDMTTFEMPDYVTHVEKNAFNGCTRLTEIKLSENLTHEGSFGILNPCINLKTLSIYDFTEIPFLAHLYGAEKGSDNGSVSTVVPTNLKTVEVHGDVQVLPDYAFYGCVGLTNVEGVGEVTSIGKYAYAYTKLFTTFKTHPSLQSVGEGAFMGCNSITGFDTTENARFLTSDKILYNTSEKFLIRVLPSVNSIDLSILTFEGIEKVGDYAFDGCSSITTLEIPSSVTIIGVNALNDCRGLKSLTIPGGEGVFTNNKSLLSLFGGATVKLDYLEITTGTKLPKEVFSLCDIKEIALPNTLVEIGELAFSRVTSLVSVTGLTNVVKIGDSAFSYCEKLKAITFGEQLEEIGWGAFGGCETLTEIEFPSSLKRIGIAAFQLCSNLSVMSFRDGAESSGLEHVGDYAFSGSSLYGDVILPASLISTGIGAFSGQDFTSVSFGGTPSLELVMASNLFAGCTLLEEVDMSNLNIKHLGSNAFYYCAALTSVSLPVGLESIGSFAFIGAAALNDVTIPNTVTQVGQRIMDNTLWAKNQDDGIMYKDHVAVGYKGAIPENSDIVFDTLYDGVICTSFFWSIGYQDPDGEWLSFSLDSVRSIVVGDGYVYINDGAFNGLKMLQAAEIGKDVKVISYGAFSNCPSLAIVTVGDSANNISALTEIGYLAFYSCASLTSLVLYKEISAIEDVPKLYYNSDGALTIFVERAVQESSNDGKVVDRIISFNQNVTIYVPSSSLTYYEMEWDWEGYFSILDLGELRVA